MSCGVGRRCGWDLALLWLWCRLAATAPIRPLVWEPSYAMGAALNKKDKSQKKKNVEAFGDGPYDGVLSTTLAGVRVKSASPP